MQVVDKWFRLGGRLMGGGEEPISTRRKLQNLPQSKGDGSGEILAVKTPPPEGNIPDSVEHEEQLPKTKAFLQPVAKPLERLRPTGRGKIAEWRSAAWLFAVRFSPTDKTPAECGNDLLGVHGHVRAFCSRRHVAPAPKRRHAAALQKLDRSLTANWEYGKLGA